MAVLYQNAGRKAIAFARGTTFTWGVRWRRQGSDGGLTPVDLTAWHCWFELRGPLGELWLRKDCSSASADGVAVARLDPEDLKDDRWDTRRGGTWRIYAGQPDGDAVSCEWSAGQDASASLLRVEPDLESGEVQLLAWDYWRAG